MSEKKAYEVRMYFKDTSDGDKYKIIGTGITNFTINKTTEDTENTYIHEKTSTTTTTYNGFEIPLSVVQDMSDDFVKLVDTNFVHDIYNTKYGFLLVHEYRVNPTDKTKYFAWHCNATIASTSKAADGGASWTTTSSLKNSGDITHGYVDSSLFNADPEYYPDGAFEADADTISVYVDDFESTDD